MTWPKTVPILTAKDIHKGSLDGPNGSHCLLGWEATLHVNASVLLKIGNAIREEVRRVAGHYATVAFNDDPLTEKADIAKVWNGAMKRLGYTEVVEVPS